MTFVAQNDPLTGKPYGSNMIIDQLAVIKEKYPLAVNTLKQLGANLHYDVNSGFVMTEDGVVVEVLEVRGWGQMQYLTIPEARQDQIGEMLADILNQLTKP